MRREGQELCTSPAPTRSNSSSPVSNYVFWRRKPSLLWKSDRHTGTVLVNSYTRYPASVSQEKGKRNRNWTQFWGTITSPVGSHYFPLCVCQNDRNDLGNPLNVWYRQSCVLKPISVELKNLHCVWKTDWLRKTSILDADFSRNEVFYDLIGHWIILVTAWFKTPHLNLLWD